MKRGIKTTKKTNDKPMTTIKIAKSMTNIKMETKAYLKMEKKEMIMATKTTMMRVSCDEEGFYN